jgi:HEAT repeat protein
MRDEGQSFETLRTRARDAYHAQDQESEDDIFWHIVWQLAARGDQATLDALLPLTTGDSFERSFSVAVLGRFDPAPMLPFESAEEVPQRFASAQIIEVLLAMLETESDEEVLESLVSSLGQHQENDERIPLALERFLDHPNPDIRWLLAAGMGSYETPEAVEMLVTLSSDEESRVRDWATFGLGSLVSLDSSEIRTALFDRLDDEDAETRIEAIEGLALRHDPRVIPVILREFDMEVEPVQRFLPSESLLEALQEMALVPDYKGDRSQVQTAIAFCEKVLVEMQRKPLQPN